MGDEVEAPTVEVKALLSGELKSISDDGTGEFLAILSNPEVDREGESVKAGAFDPLPSSIPIHVNHDWAAKADPVGVGTPYYDGETLMVRGMFATTPRAQEVRALVNQGAYNAMSAGFLVSQREGKSILKADLFEGSVTSVPVLRSARILVSKAIEAEIKAGARNSSADAARIQQMHDTACELGAMCGEAKAITPADEPTTKSIPEAAGDAAANEAAAAPAAEDEEALLRLQVLADLAAAAAL